MKRNVQGFSLREKKVSFFLEKVYRSMKGNLVSKEKVGFCYDFKRRKENVSFFFFLTMKNSDFFMEKSFKFKKKKAQRKKEKKIKIERK